MNADMTISVCRFNALKAVIEQQLHRNSIRLLGKGEIKNDKKEEQAGKNSSYRQLQRFNFMMSTTVVYKKNI
jgi:hypothetical protein